MMRTDELVTMLANGPVAADAGAVARRCAIGAGWAALGAMLLTAVLFGVRDDLSEVAWLPMFWVKLGVVAALAAAGVAINLRLARPGKPLGRLPLVLAAPVLLLWILAIAVFATADPSVRPVLLFGDTWAKCLVAIPLLSLPGLAAVLWAMRGLAPTRLALAGAAAGLLAGAIGAVAYSLYCPELAAPFVAVWYLLGIAAVAAVGGLLGPRVLRW